MTAAAESAEGAGLVSVPTSLTRLPIREGGTYAQPEDFFRVDNRARRLAGLRRSIGAAARLMGTAPVGHRPERVVMVTLTYRDGKDWQPRHVAELLQRVRMWHVRRGIKPRYVWVAELQQRGAIHYHIALWLPRGLTLPKPDKQGWWPHGMTRTEQARYAVPYLLKYMSKDTSKTFGEFPHGARLYGVGGLDVAARRVRRWLGWPAMLQANFDVNAQCRRAVGGGWLTPLGFMASEFRAIVSKCKRTGERIVSIARVLTQPRSIDAAGPFSWVAP